MFSFIQPSGLRARTGGGGGGELYVRTKGEKRRKKPFLILFARRTWPPLYYTSVTLFRLGFRSTDTTDARRTIMCMTTNCLR